MKTIDALRDAIAATALLVSIGANASNGALALKRTLEQAHPHTRFTQVTPSEIPGLYEVWMGSNLAYVFADRPHLFLFGRLFDTHTMRDLTAAKLSQQETRPDEPAASTLVALDALPLQDALKRVNGRGERRLILFSDPLCLYCKQFERELEKIDDVTVYTFLLPLLGESEAIAIWCAAEPLAAWSRAMIGGQRPDASDTRTCAHPMQRNLELAQRLQIFGTPTLIFADGRRHEGVLDAAALVRRLGQAAGTTRDQKSVLQDEARP